ncbi:MAG: DUF1987 domain-containing protein [Bacteroidales bacterium]
MDPVIIEPTNYSPQVVFEANGNLSIKGRSLMLDAVSFYQPLIEWASSLITPSVNLNFELDYFNTSSSKKLLDLLKVFDNNRNVNEFIVHWAFENDDEDTLMKGQLFEERLKNARFNYKELSGI